jgi:hypothetical protein
VLTKAQQLGIKFRIAPVGLLHRGAQVVEVQNLGDTSERAKGILQATNQVLGRLMKDRLAVSFAGETQDDAQDPGPTAAAATLYHRGPRPEVHLDLLAWLDLDAPDPLGLLVAQLTNEPFDRLIGATEADFGQQVLIDPLRTQAGLQLGLDAFAMRITETGPTHFGGQSCSHVAMILPGQFGAG